MDARKQGIGNCKKLTKEDVSEKSKRICEQIASFLKPGMCIGFYMAMKHEVDLSSLLDEWIEQAVCAVPRCRKHGLMDFYFIQNDSIFEVNAYGILEPSDGELVDKNCFDVILVPMVGFDEQLHRLGHGAGYYDRWLSQSSAFKIGVAFEVQKVERLNKQEHDVDMDIIITEANIYRKSETL